MSLVKMRDWDTSVDGPERVYSVRMASFNTVRIQNDDGEHFGWEDPKTGKLYLGLRVVTSQSKQDEIDGQPKPVEKFTSKKFKFSTSNDENVKNKITDIAQGEIAIIKVISKASGAPGSSNFFYCKMEKSFVNDGGSITELDAISEKNANTGLPSCGVSLDIEVDSISISATGEVGKPLSWEHKIEIS